MHLRNRESLNFHLKRNRNNKMKPTNVLLLAASLSVSLVQAAPVITCPDPARVPCSSNATVSVAVIDPQGSDLGVIWSVNGAHVQTNSIPGAQSLLGQNNSFT